MERRGAISKGIERARGMIFKNQERAYKVAYSEYAVAALSLIGMAESIEHNLHGVITIGLFALAGLFGFAGRATENRALYTPSRDPIMPWETSVRTYHPPSPPNPLIR